MSWASSGKNMTEYPIAEFERRVLSVWTKANVVAGYPVIWVIDVCATVFGGLDYHELRKESNSKLKSIWNKYE